jgi:hypothetical protein
VKKLALISLTSLAFVACGKGSNKNPIANIKQAAADRDLQNTFQSDCSTKVGALFVSGVATAGAATVKSLRTQYDFKGANVSRRMTYYTSADCSGEAFNYTENGSFETHKDQKTNDGGYSVDMHFKKVSAKALNDAGVTIANAIGICDKKDWQVGKEVDVTDHSADMTCYGAAEPRDDFNIYRVDNGVLTLGNASLDSRSPDDRPVILKSERFSKK